MVDNSYPESNEMLMVYENAVQAIRLHDETGDFEASHNAEDELLILFVEHVGRGVHPPDVCISVGARLGKFARDSRVYWRRWTA